MFQTSSPEAAYLRASSCVVPASSSDVANSHNFHKGQQTILTPAQQKQILENLLVQQNKYSSKPKPTGGAQYTIAGNTFSVNSNTCNSSQSKTLSKTLVKKVQKAPILTVTSSVTTPSNMYQTVNFTNHLIQMSTSNTNSSASKILVETHNGVTKENNKVQPKQQPLVPRQIILPTVCKDGNSINATTNINVLANHTKPPTILIQTATPGARISRVVNSVASTDQTLSSRQPFNDAFCVKERTNQIVTKGVANSDECIPQENKTNTTMRTIDTTTNNAKLIQFSNHSTVLPIAQYAVVSQNTNIMKASQSVTQSSMQKNVTTSVKKFTGKFKMDDFEHN